MNVRKLNKHLFFSFIGNDLICRGFDLGNMFCKITIWVEQSNIFQLTSRLKKCSQSERNYCLLEIKLN